MNRNYFLIIVAVSLACLFLIFFSMLQEIDTSVTKEPLIPPPKAPYKSYISGVGIVEPSSGSISIGTPVNRLVEKIFVTVGAKVKEGDILFFLENRDLKANLAVQEAAYKSAQAKLERLEAFPRPEDLEVAKSALEDAKTELALAKNQYEMILQLSDPRAISQEERNRRLFNFQQAEAKWKQAEAKFDKVKQGTWNPDLEIARFEVIQAKANVQLVTTEIQRTIIQSPINGSVLQIKIHEGEYPPLDISRSPAMILGNIDEMNLRVSINQLDLPNFDSKAPAVAYLQGDSRDEFPLEFIRVEPLLVNKQNLSNEIMEKVDTRVLQIIYRIKSQAFPIFVEQQMDVFIEAKKSS